MIYVALTSVTLKKNPIKRVRFVLYATRRLLQGGETALLAETNCIGGQFLTMTVWETREEMLAFQQYALRRLSARQLIQDVASDSVVYRFETNKLPTWDEAVNLLEAEEEALIAHAQMVDRSDDGSWQTNESANLELLRQTKI